MRRLPVRVPCSFKLHAAAGADGMITHLSARVAVVETQARVELGTETVLRIEDEAGARAYHFACEIVRSTPRGMVVRLVGIPVECRYLAPTPVAELADVVEPRAA